jgi:hypothetical protein
VETAISTYRVGGLIESGRSERHPHSFFIPVAKTLRSLPKQDTHIYAGDYLTFVGFHCICSPVVPLNALYRRIDKACLAAATFHGSFPKFAQSIGDLE